MCVDSEIFNYLCELYPETAQNLTDLAKEQREIILHFHKQAQLVYAIDHAGVPIGLNDSRRLSATGGSPLLDGVRINSKPMINLQRLPVEKNDLNDIDMKKSFEEEIPMSLQQSKEYQLAILNTSGQK